MDDPLGQAQHGGLDEQPAAEHDQQGQARVTAVGQAASRSDIAALLVLAGLSAVAPHGAAAFGHQHEQRQAEQPDERERQQPGALVAEAALEQPQWPDAFAEGDRVAFAAVGEEHGRRARRLDCAHGAGLGGPAVAGSNALGDAAGADRDLSGPARLPADAAEAVVAERQTELGVVGRAADVGSLGGRRQFDGEHPCGGDGDQDGAGGEQLSQAATQRPGRAEQEGERDRRHDQVRGERLRVEGQADERAAAQQRSASGRVRTRAARPRRRGSSAGSEAHRRCSFARRPRTRGTRRVRARRRRRPSRRAAWPARGRAARRTARR